jgi:hypothetical protein
MIWTRSRRVVTLVVGAAGLGLGASEVRAGVAQAASTSTTVTATTVDPGSADTANNGFAAWKSGSLTLAASRVSDGRVKARAVLTLVTRREFRAQVAIAPCNADVNPGSPPEAGPVFTNKGADATRSVHMRKGTNNLVLEAVVSSNAAGEYAPRNWTDCVVADVIDEAEYATTLSRTPEVAKRLLDFAFGAHAPRAVLTTTGSDGQRL